MEETDKELIARRDQVKGLVAAAEKKMGKMKFGPARSRQARWVGSLRFTLLSTESDIRSKGLASD